MSKGHFSRISNEIMSAANETELQCFLIRRIKFIIIKNPISSVPPSLPIRKDQKEKNLQVQH